jgi:amino acid transporter
MKDNQTTSSKSMGLWSATSIGVGAMIGAGLFALIGIAVDIAGQTAFLAFIVAGIVALLTSYSVSKLAVQFPSKGGPVEYLNKGYGKGVFAGGLNIIMWIGYIIVTSLYARAFAEYSTALLGLGENSIWLYIFGSAIVIIFVIINFIGAAAVGASELLIVAIKVFVLILFGILGLNAMNMQEFAITSEFDLGDLVLASGVVFMSYEGFGLVANTAEDIENPKKTLPMALFLSIIIVMIIYAMVSIAVIGNLSIQEILEAKEYALAEAAKPVMGSLGFTVMGVAALFSTASAINATIYGPVHMLQETAKAKQIPPFFTRKLFDHESGYALLITALIILAISNLLNLDAIAETGSLVFLIIYTAVNVANFRLRKQTSIKACVVWLGIVSTTFSFVALFYYQILEAILSAYLFLTIVLAGFAYQWFYQRYRKSPSRE